MAKLNFQELEKAILQGLLRAADFLRDETKEITPRDFKRPPQLLKFKGKFYDTPKRNVRKGNKHRYIPVIPFGGGFIPGVTGNLKRSIYSVKTGVFEYRIGTGEEYGKYLELGTPTMKPRSFLGKTMNNKKNEAQKIFADTIRKLTGK